MSPDEFDPQTTEWWSDFAINVIGRSGSNGGHCKPDAGESGQRRMWEMVFVGVAEHQ